MLDVRVCEGYTLLIGRPEGTLDLKMATEIVEFVEIHEEQLEMGFNRFCDFTVLEGIDLQSADVRELAKRRRWFNPNNIRVKSAFLATDPLAFGIARMYEQLLDSPRIEVRVWKDLLAAADWLEIKPEKLALRSPTP
jgi:hypothetical protein